MIGARTARSFTVPDWAERNAQKPRSAGEGLLVVRSGPETTPPGAAAYPRGLEATCTLANDEAVLIRPVKPSDEDPVLEFFYSLSQDAVFFRFFRARKRMPRREVQHLVVVDYRDRMAFVAVSRKEERERIVGVACYERDPASNLAEAALVVQDKWQRQGLGSLLLLHLIRSAMTNSIEGFTGLVLPGNYRMLNLLHKAGYLVRSTFEEGLQRVTFRFDERREPE